MEAPPSATTSATNFSTTPKPLNRLAPHFKTMLAKVRPGWRKIFDSPQVRPTLHAAIRELNQSLLNRGVTDAILEWYGLDYFIVPPHAEIFAAFHWFDPQNLRGVIVGQDPYAGYGSSSPKGDNAMGMSFSVREGRKVPGSLENIYSALGQSGLLATLPTTGYLVNWARQGMLMLNAYLTRSTNFSVSGDQVSITGTGSSDDTLLHDFWGGFTSALLSYLTRTFIPQSLNHRSHYVAIMLWGGFAHKLEKHMAASSGDRTIVIMKHGHPSNMSPVNRDPSNPKAFINCPHFLEFSKHEPDFVWDPSAPYTERPSRMSQFYSLLRELGDMKTEVDLEQLIDHGTAYHDGTQEANNLRLKAMLEAKQKLAPAVPAVKAPAVKAPTLKAPAPKAPAPKAPKAINPTKPISAEVAYLVIAADGGCTDNGKRRARASYANYTPATFLGQPNVIHGADASGLVPATDIIMDYDTLELREGESAMTPTNNRGELLASIHAVRTVLRYYREHPSSGLRMILILDSEYVIHFINERMWNYRLRTESISGGNGKTPAKEWYQIVAQNHDLIRILGELLLLLAEARGKSRTNLKACWHCVIQPAGRNYFRERGAMDAEWPGLTVLYQRSHQPKPDSDTAIDREKWEANRQVDAACQQALM